MNRDRILILILVISLMINIGLAIYSLRMRTLSNKVDYQKKYIVLKGDYLSLAKVQKNLLEVMMKRVDLQDEFKDEYRDLGPEEFKELLRRKIVKLQLEIERLSEETNN